MSSFGSKAYLKKVLRKLVLELELEGVVEQVHHLVAGCIDPENWEQVKTDKRKRRWGGLETGQGQGDSFSHRWRLCG